MRTLLATVFNNLFLVLGSLFFGTVAIVGSVVAPRSGIATWSARGWARGLLSTAGARLDVRYEQELDPDERYVFMSNHQSQFDVPSLLATLPVSARFLAKRQLFAIPVFGTALRLAGFIPVDREDRSRARESLHAALAQIEGGHSIVVFPEETRSSDGRIGPFKRGGFLIALKAGRPVVPVGIGGARLIQTKETLIVRPGPLRLRYGRPIDPSASGVRGSREFVELVRDEVIRLSGEPGEDFDGSALPPGQTTADRLDWTNDS